jgi:hypothetical protein
VLTIRDEQIQAFRDAQWERFLGTLLAQARSEYPEVTSEQDDETLLKLLRTAAETAPQHGMFQEADICRYCLLAVWLGADPAEISRFLEIVTDFDTMGATKLAALARAAGLPE